MAELEQRLPHNEKYYGRLSVLIGSFFGSVLCGAYMTAHNLKADGRRDQVLKIYGIALAIGVVGVGIPYLLEYIVGKNLPFSTPFTVAQMLVFILFFDKNFKKEDLAAKPKVSGWVSFGVSLIFFAAVMALAFGGAYLYYLLTRVTSG